MVIMELEIYEALTAVNVPADKAKAVVSGQLMPPSTNAITCTQVSWLREEIRGRKNGHHQMACVASIFGAVALFAAIVKIL